MLRNALPAEKPAALGTSGHRFAKLMMVTALVCQVLHRGFNCQYSYLMSFCLRLKKIQPLQEMPKIKSD